MPLQHETGDFALRVSEVLRTLEHVEQRSQLEILRDLRTSSSDLIRIRASASQTTTGSIPLDLGVRFVEEAREMMLAAACSAIDPRPYYATRKPVQANEYLSRVRMGQTERGSFVLTILSPVPPGLRPPEPLDGVLPDPFERKVSQTLASGLLAARLAAQRAAVSGDVQPFREAVPRGVSANLCDALVGPQVSWPKESRSPFRGLAIGRLISRRKASTSFPRTWFRSLRKRPGCLGDGAKRGRRNRGLRHRPPSRRGCALGPGCRERSHR